MTWIFQASAIPLLMAGVISFALSIYSWRYRHKRIGAVFIALTSSVGIWSFGEFFQRGALTDFARVFATSINFTVIPLSAVLMFMFTLYFTDRANWLNRQVVTLLLGWSLFDSLIMWTNNWHGLMFESITMAGFVRGPFFIVHTVVSYLFTLASIFLVAQLFFKSTKHRRQTGILLAGVVYPLIGNLLFVLHILPYEGDWTPFNFVISLMIIGLALYGSGVLDVSLIVRRELGDNLADLMITTDKAGQVVSLNESAKRAFAFTDGLPLDLDGFDMFDPKWSANLKQDEPRTVKGEIALTFLADQRVFFDVRGSELRDASDAFQGYVYILRDISERKAAEEALYNERILAEQLAEKYREARDEALDASRAKSELLARVSHELRTPLGAMLGYTQTLRSTRIGPLTEKQEKALQRILANGQDLELLIDDILNETQLNTGNIQLSIDSLNPIHIVEHVIGQMKPAADEKSLDLSLVIDSGAPETVEGDRFRLQQVLTNLVSNAIKYTDEGSVQVSLFSCCEDRWGFSVIDSGVGIASEKQQIVFQPFVQIDGSSTRRHGGVGLGLSIVKKIVDLLDGEIELKSESGRGSSFRVTFPLQPQIEEIATARA